MITKSEESKSLLKFSVISNNDKMMMIVTKYTNNTRTLSCCPEWSIEEQIIYCMVAGQAINKQSRIYVMNATESRF